MEQNVAEKVREKVCIYHRRKEPRVVYTDELKEYENEGWTTKPIVASTKISDMRRDIAEAEAELVKLKANLASEIEAEAGYETVKLADKNAEHRKK